MTVSAQTLPPTDRRAHAQLPKFNRKWTARVGYYLFALRTWTMFALRPPKATIAKLFDIPLTTIGIGCIDFAAFHVSSGFGWLVTGLSLIALEFMIADET